MQHSVLLAVVGAAEGPPAHLLFPPPVTRLNHRGVVADEQRASGAKVDDELVIEAAECAGRTKLPKPPRVNAEVTIKQRSALPLCLRLQIDPVAKDVLETRELHLAALRRIAPFDLVPAGADELEEAWGWHLLAAEGEGGRVAEDEAVGVAEQRHALARRLLYRGGSRAGCRCAGGRGAERRGGPWRTRRGKLGGGRRLGRHLGHLGLWRAGLSLRP
mmetsp:Transcript_3494/g.7882  ORF Transcript_3494/g.7882 Transcript_3494/m.7882 type:complete len:217 (+) Transcript_3494:747-1397(+)